MVKENKPHIYIKNKSMPLLLGNIRPFIPSINSKLSLRSVHTHTGGGSPQVVPLLSYANADVLKKVIIGENKDKTGIYR
jgi:hypothetical protein